MKFVSRPFALGLSFVVAALASTSQAASLKCSLEAYHSKSAQSLTSSFLLKDVQPIQEGKTLKIIQHLVYAADESLLIEASLVPETGDFSAGVREYGKKGSTFWFPYGVGNGSFQGKLAPGKQKIMVTVPLKGTIADGYLAEREDHALVEYSGMMLTCDVDVPAPKDQKKK
ncbi:MAG TPA: hypothetical protein VFV50_07580 [Bdellovibrionales bacterium]|nr:hypothetical protein [Bdellovibrionales bacterium]